MFHTVGDCAACHPLPLFTVFYLHFFNYLKRIQLPRTTEGIEGTEGTGSKNTYTSREEKTLIV